MEKSVFNVPSVNIKFSKHPIVAVIKLKLPVVEYSVDIVPMDEFKTLRLDNDE